MYEAEKRDLVMEMSSEQRDKGKSCAEDRHSTCQTQS